MECYEESPSEEKTGLNALEAFISDNSDLEELEFRLSSFNIFEAIGATRRELRHSDFLKYVLDPSENHGLGDYVLKEFAKYVISNNKNCVDISIIDIDTFNLVDTELRREWRNIDILAISKANNFVICVENKIDTAEHSDQLTRYESIINDEYAEYIKLFIYLTPDGTQSKENESWTAVSYIDIHNVLSKVIKNKSSIIGKDIYTLLEHYIEMVNRHIMTDNNISDLCKKIYNNHKKAIDLIIEHKPDVYADIKDYLLDLIVNTNVDNIIMDHCTKYYIRFIAEEWDGIERLHLGEGWTSTKRILIFEISIETAGVGMKLYIGPGNKQVRDGLFDIAKNNNNIFKGCSNKQSAKWTTIYKKQLLSKLNIESGDFDGCTTTIQDKWHDFITNDYEKIAKTISTEFR